MFSQHQNKQCRLACLSPLHPQSQNCISTFECWGVALLYSKNMKDITLLNRATFLHVWNMNQNHSSPLTGALRSYSKKKTTFFSYNQYIIRKNQVNFSLEYLGTYLIWSHGTHRYLILFYILWYISAIQSHSAYSKVVKIPHNVFGQHILLLTKCRSKSMQLGI